MNTNNSNATNATLPFFFVPLGPQELHRPWIFGNKTLCAWHLLSFSPAVISAPFDPSG